MPRPKKPPEEKQSAAVTVRLTPSELARLDNLCQAAGVGRGAWFRQLLEDSVARGADLVELYRETLRTIPETKRWTGTVFREVVEMLVAAHTAGRKENNNDSSAVR